MNERSLAHPPQAECFHFGQGTAQAGGPQENGSRQAAETAGIKNETIGIADGVNEGTGKTAGAAASTGVIANWQIEQ